MSVDLKVENCSQSPIETNKEDAVRLATTVPDEEAVSVYIEDVSCNLINRWVKMEVVVDPGHKSEIGCVYCCEKCNLRTKTNPGYINTRLRKIGN